MMSARSKGLLLYPFLQHMSCMLSYGSSGLCILFVSITSRWVLDRWRLYTLLVCFHRAPGCSKGLDARVCVCIKTIHRHTHMYIIKWISFCIAPNAFRDLHICFPRTLYPSVETQACFPLHLQPSSVASTVWVCTRFSGCIWIAES